MIRRCIDCQGPIARKTKFRCRNCHTEFMKRKIGPLNSAWKEYPSKVALNRCIILRHGNAKECNNINCRNKTGVRIKSKSYRWIRLKHRSGREGGIWIQLCLSCARKLDEVYHHNPNERNSNERKIRREN